MHTIIKNAQLFTEDGVQVTRDILIQNGIISDIQEELAFKEAIIIQAEGLLLSPGFVD